MPMPMLTLTLTPKAYKATLLMCRHAESRPEQWQAGNIVRKRRLLHATGSNYLVSGP